MDKNKSILYCDNPQCKRPIQDEEVAYDAEHREVYHVGLCGKMAKAHRAITSGEPAVSNVDYISRAQALKLLDLGRLAQAGKLEEEVQPPHP